MKNPENQMLVIFGASGDLTKRKLIPSLFELCARGLLPDKFVVLGASRTEYSDEEYRRKQRESILAIEKGKPYKEEQVDEFLEKVYYVSFDSTRSEEYSKLKTRIQEIQKRKDIPDRIIYYLSTPPLMYELIPKFLKENNLNKPFGREGWRRIIIEKPFGTSEESARKLNKYLRTIFDEKGIYRIDHFLGKETVQNILVLRFSNGIFEPLWNRNYIDSIEISASETLGIEDRGKYYESSGALRDMIQNHLMQLTAFVAMEAPATFDPESIRDEIVKVFRAVHPYTEEEIDENVIRGQYIGSRVKGKEIEGYRKEKDVSLHSTVETFVAMRLYIDNWRWGGVPFYLYTGKQLACKSSEIIINFKSTPIQLFAGQCSGGSCNQLKLGISPDESISLKFGLKMPGAGFVVKQVSMDFRYDSLSENYLPDAYERLLLDAMLGDSTLYARSDALEASWHFIDPIVEKWQRDLEHNLHFYPAGSKGPKVAQKMLGAINDCLCRKNTTR
ncbi:glucose-6-phosphate dehydrogenase [Parabacteroides pacaensis]|uniref:glucose-6-phosphate dehydrogenase n=1 Tax=Parabacteroides pacaensis TaxID=2086575 RepID=UPI000D0E4451|nr:glucose-6-phosphate dehydrogenase [Parabacteroides pacaensis]